jgi:hypothetical protein
MIQAFVRGVSVWGPGLLGWKAARSVLTGATSYMAEEAPPPSVPILPAAERRRSGPVVRLALAAAYQAVESAEITAAALHSVFATSNGDAAVVHAILETLVSPEPYVSPTQFHNSVHNAAPGYWTIGARSSAPATCLGCHDATFAAALLKAVSELHVERRPVLLCLYDMPMPAPLAAHRPTSAAFAAAFVLEPEPSGHAFARIRVTYQAASSLPEQEEPRLPALRALNRSNPAARSLRLLEALAGPTADDFTAALLDGSVWISVTASPLSAPSGRRGLG